MMYIGNLAVAIKVEGKVLKENGKVVYIPFGSEYSIFLKNLNTKDAVIDIEIDGNKVTRDGIFLAARKSMDLERPITKNMNSGNKFKFIERTSSIDEVRDIKVMDGLIKIAFSYRKEVHVTFELILTLQTLSNDTFDRCKLALEMNYGNIEESLTYLRENPRKCSYRLNSSGILKGGHSRGITSQSTTDFMSYENENGITVSGSKSNQSFVEVKPFTLEEEKHVLVFSTKGVTKDNQYVETPITGKSKKVCKTCFTPNDFDAKFCKECTTSLIIY